MSVRESRAFLNSTIPLFSQLRQLQPPNSTTPTPAPPRASRTSLSPPTSSHDPTLLAHLTRIHASHAELSSLWSTHSDRVVSYWKELALPGLREAKVGAIFDAVVPRSSYPEFETARMVLGDNLLDFVGARAERDPVDFAFHLDLT